jgi:DNA-directed RNA polymerase alpha subunit
MSTEMQLKQGLDSVISTIRDLEKLALDTGLNNKLDIVKDLIDVESSVSIISSYVTVDNVIGEIVPESDGVVKDNIVTIPKQDSSEVVVNGETGSVKLVVSTDTKLVDLLEARLISNRSYNALAIHGKCETVGDVSNYDMNEVKKIRGLGTESFKEIHELFKSYGIRFKPRRPKKYSKNRNKPEAKSLPNVPKPVEPDTKVTQICTAKPVLVGNDSVRKFYGNTVNTESVSYHTS